MPFASEVLESNSHIFLLYKFCFNVLFYLIFYIKRAKLKGCAQLYNWIYHCNIYQPPLLSLKGRDVDHFPTL